MKPTFVGFFFNSGADADDAAPLGTLNLYYNYFFKLFLKKKYRHIGIVVEIIKEF